MSEQLLLSVDLKTLVAKEINFDENSGAGDVTAGDQVT